MRLFSGVSFRKKLTAIVLGTAIVALLFASTVFSLIEVFQFKKNLENQTSLFADIIAASTTPSLAMKIPHEADSLLGTLVSDPHVTAVFLFDENGEPFAQYLRPVKDAKDGRDLFPHCASLTESGLPSRDTRCFSWDHLGLFRFIYLDGKKIGSVYLQSDLEPLYSQMKSFGFVITALLLQATLLAILVAYPLQRIVTRPVLHLAEKIKKVSEDDDFSVRAEKFSQDEIGVLTDGFNEMLDHLEENRNALLRHQEELEAKVHARTMDLQEKNVELLSAKKSAESSSLAKSSFLANVSHELRTPMVGVMGIAELLMEGDLTQRQRHLLETIHKSGESLLDIFNDILDFSRIEADKMRLVEEEFDLWEILEDAVALFGELSSKKGLELVCDIAPDLPERLWGDAGRLRQTLVNLVGNAVKFTEKGEVRVVADLVSERTGREISLRIEIADTGPGIDRSSQESIFEAFTQRDESASRKHGGAGLGLSIVKGIVDLMGGEISLESEPGRGTTFLLDLTMRLPGGYPSSGFKRRILEGKTVLIGGVSPALRRSLARQIEGLGAVILYADAEGEVLPLLESLQDLHLALIDEVLFEGAFSEETIRKRLETLSEEGRLVIFRRLGHEKGREIERYSHLFTPVRPSLVRKYLLTDYEQGCDALLPEVPVSQASPSEFAILVAEDDPASQKLMKLFLETLGYRVRIANCGFDVLAALDQEPFDLILMDCQMPRLDGFETTRRLRSQGSHLPIVALTAHVSPSRVEECLKAGMDAFLSKPFKKKDLLEILERLTKGSPTVDGTQGKEVSP